MRLADFELSLANLKNNFQIFFESQGQLLPIVSIKRMTQGVVLSAVPVGTPLTLKQLSKGFLSLTDDHAQVLIASPGQEHLVFGYRLTQTKILIS